MTRTATRTAKLDQVCADAVDVARQAVTEVPASEVGAHEGVVSEGDRLVTHYFQSLRPGYRGWQWAVTLTRAPRSKLVTVCETVLVPGPDALLAPGWLPWEERLRPGDLGVGDLLPTSADDDRLVPGYTMTEDDSDRQMIFEYGLGRARVLSAYGRDLAVRRWHASEHGPHTPIAHAAPAQCSTCGFYWPLAGALGRGFGVCANEFAPDDGRVVAADHGCGAHSEASVQPAAVETAAPILDDLGYDLMEVPAPIAAGEEGREEEEPPPGSVDETASEPLGHS